MNIFIWSCLFHTVHYFFLWTSLIIDWSIAISMKDVDLSFCFIRMDCCPHLMTLTVSWWWYNAQLLQQQKSTQRLCTSAMYNTTDHVRCIFNRIKVIKSDNANYRLIFLVQQHELGCKCNSLSWYKCLYKALSILHYSNFIPY